MNFAPQSNRTVNQWVNTLESRASQLQSASGAAIVVTGIILAAVLAFGTYEMDDIPIVALLILSVISTVPVVEVARMRDSTGLFSRRLTMDTWRQGIMGPQKYDVLSSGMTFMQPAYAVTSILSAVLFATYKLGGERYLTRHALLVILLLQLPFNPIFGWNPLAMSMLQGKVSKFVQQSDLRNYMMQSRSNNVNRRPSNRNRSSTFPKNYMRAAATPSTPPNLRSRVMELPMPPTFRNLPRRNPTEPFKVNMPLQ